MNKLRALIIDDEEPCIEVLSLLLSDYHSDVVVLDIAMSMEEGLRKIEEHKQSIDILFLDIQMPGGDGFTLLERLASAPFKIIFTTAYTEYAIKAIKFSAFDYLLKPIDDDELTHAILKYREESKKGTFLNDETDMLKKMALQSRTIEKIPISTPNEIRFIAVNHIVYMESDNNYTYIYLDNQPKILSSKHLGYFEELLSPDQFFRIHKSYLVNIDKVVCFIKGKSGFLQLENGIKLEISNRRKESVLHWLGI
jgi:two-component system LytT family response regulator